MMAARAAILAGDVVHGKSELRLAGGIGSNPHREVASWRPGQQCLVAGVDDHHPGTSLTSPILDQRKQDAAHSQALLPRIFTIPPDLDAALGLAISGDIRPANGLVTY
jgi:hypothetical protein